MLEGKFNEDLIIVLSQTNREAVALFNRFAFRPDIFDKTVRISNTCRTVYLTDNRVFKFTSKTEYYDQHIDILKATVYTDMEFEQLYFEED